MTTHMLCRTALLAAAVFLVVSGAVAAEPLLYELRFDKPNSHLLDIAVHASGLSGPAVEFAMPDWAPGAYSINDYAKNVQEFSAAGANGQPLAWWKVDKQTWRIELGSNAAVTAHYKLYADTLANNWAQYNDRHAFLGGPAVWMYLVGGKERPIQLVINVPAGWKVATGMERIGENTFAAADYDWFADSPIEISDYAEKTFSQGGTTYHVVVHDVLGHKDFAKFTADTEKIVAALVPIFAPVVGSEGPAPFKTYWFLFHIWPNSGGGLEHLSSTQINFSSDWDDTQPAGRSGTRYDLKLFVTAHEFFHAWNVKRLRPKPLGPFDYSREVPTPSLWISEGLTSYYGQLGLLRAGLVTPEAYLDSIAKLITSFEETPGRKERSIEDTSWDTWFRSTGQPATNLANTNYSYYDGGQLVGHLLDFAIRQATGNQKSLDDWMRLLYQQYALPRPGFEPEDAVRLASEVTRHDMSDFFRRYIQGKEPLPYETYFGYASIRVEKHLDPDKPWLGATLERNDDGRARIKNITPGSPAENAGLDRGDILLAANGKDVKLDEFTSALESHKPGDTLKLTLVRLGELKEISATLGSNPNPTYTLKPLEHPTELQKKIYETWLGKK